MKDDMTADEAEEYWKKAGGPAFPYPDHHQGTKGMTLRDYFASCALTGITSVNPFDSISFEQCAKAAYELANEMLKCREEGVE